MVERKVTIHETVVEFVAEIALYVEGRGLLETARKFIDDAFSFFEELGDSRITHRPCGYVQWRKLSYRCATFRKKYTIAYLENATEIIICDIALSKMLVSDLK